MCETHTGLRVLINDVHMNETIRSTAHRAVNRRLSILEGARTIPGWVTWGIVLGLFCVYFLPGLWTSFFQLLHSEGRPLTTQSLSERLTRDVGFALLAIVIYRMLRPSVSGALSLDAEPPKLRHRTVLQVFFLYGLIMAGNQVMIANLATLPIWGWTGSFGSDIGNTVTGSVNDSPIILVGSLIMSMFAGINEELTLVAIPLIMFSRTGVSLKAAVPLLIAMRMCFHLYHGIPTMLIMGIWAALALYLYWRTSTILPMILGHALMDITAFGGAAFGPAVAATLGGLVSYVLIIGGIVVLILAWRGGKKVPTETPA